MQENILMAKKKNKLLSKCPSDISVGEDSANSVSAFTFTFFPSLSLSPVHNNNGPLSAQEIFDATTVSSQHISYDSKIQKQIYTWTKNKAHDSCTCTCSVEFDLTYWLVATLYIEPIEYIG